jgi:hypothetical protein
MTTAAAATAIASDVCLEQWWWVSGVCPHRPSSALVLGVPTEAVSPSLEQAVLFFKGNLAQRIHRCALNGEFGTTVDLSTFRAAFDVQDLCTAIQEHLKTIGFKCLQRDSNRLDVSWCSNGSVGPQCKSTQTD